MNALTRPKGGCEICRLKNVQVQPIGVGLGQNSPQMALRIASKHSVVSLGDFLSKCYLKCPSPCPSPTACPSPADTLKRYLNLEGYVMEANVELVWLPLARIAALQGKSVKTIRRMIEDGNLISVKRTVKGDKSHTNKSFVLALQDTIDLDKQLCRKQGVIPQYLGLEMMQINQDEFVSMFITSYHKERAVGYGED